MTFDLSSLLGEGVILPLAQASSRKQALIKLASELGQTVAIEPRDIIEAVMEREQLGSTGVGEGVAIPHARLKRLEKPVGGYMRLQTGVDFDAVDERDCDIVFMLLAPLSAGADHLRALAQVSRALRQGTVRDRLRAATSEAEVRAILCSATSNASAA